MKALSIIVIVAVLAASGLPASPAIRRVNTDEKVIALTFDDGPHPTITAEILDILDKYDARATFFVIGENAKNYPDVLRMISSRGHEIGNHTYTHKSVRKKNVGEIIDEIELAEEAILSVCDAKTKVFRPPEGCFTKNVAEAAAKLGYSVILWSVDTRDWAHCDAATITENIKNNIRPGGVILFHDYVSGESYTKNALEIILPYLGSLGYRFVTVSELIGLS